MSCFFFSIVSCPPTVPEPLVKQGLTVKGVNKGVAQEAVEVLRPLNLARKQVHTLEHKRTAYTPELIFVAETNKARISHNTTWMLQCNPLSMSILKHFLHCFCFVSVVGCSMNFGVVVVVNCGKKTRHICDFGLQLFTVVVGSLL